jgi:hypothetical protein
VKRLWPYLMTLLAYGILLYGIALLVGSGVDAYMVGMTGAHPGDVIFMNTLATPLRTSLFWLAIGLLAIGTGLILSRFARVYRRRLLTTVGAGREG